MAYANVAEPFMASVNACPDKAAVIFEDEIVTYREMNELVNRTAHALRDDLSVKPGDRVAYLLPNGIEILVIYYAIQKIGAIAVPLNFKLIAREIDYLVGASGAKILFFSAGLAEKVSEVRAGHAQVKLISVGAYGEEFSPLPEASAYEQVILGHPPEEPELFRDASSISRIQYTGGSTGVPKGAARTHHADLVELAGILDANKLAEVPDNVVLIQCPLEHHGGHSWFTITFAAGATLVVCDVFQAERILQRIQRYRVTYMILLPPITYLRLLGCPTIDEYDLSSVKLVQSAAGGTTKEIIRSIYDHFPNAELSYGWGQSESGLGTTLMITRALLDQDSPLLASVGKPMAGLELKIIDDNGCELPTGVPGEAVVRSEAVMAGYYGEPALTDAVFTPDGWLRTGDIMVKDEQGYLTIKSRKKDMIKSGGENVFVAEVETTLNSHPLVADCLVFGTEDPVMGEAVAAVVELCEGALLDPVELQDFCKQHIASYKKPRYITFIDSLGRDDAGKIRRQNIIDYFDTRKKSITPRCYEQIHDSPDVYVIYVPFLGNPLKFSNVYVIKTDDRNALIDTGVCQEKALYTLKTALYELGVDMEKTDIFLTHFHIDHIGLAATVAAAGTRIFLSSVDFHLLEKVYTPDYQRIALARLQEEGVSVEMAQDMRETLTRYAKPSKPLPVERVRHLHEGQTIHIGSYWMEVIDTPGHTPGHQCFYLPDARIMFYGDHVLMNVSPNVTVWPETHDTLERFLQSLDKISEYAVELACMGHGPVDDQVKSVQIQQRVARLKHHHAQRLAEIEDYLAMHPGASGMEVAKNISWSIPYDSWDEISVVQKWFTISEASAHLEHAVETGDVERTIENGIRAYRICAERSKG